MEKLILLGTGNATVTNCYNTCFALQDKNHYMLVDAGGGNGILQQLKKASIKLEQINTMFVTHCHSDHILGTVWLIRMIATKMLQNEYEGTFTIFGHDKVIAGIRTLCDVTLQQKLIKLFDTRIVFKTVIDGQVVSIENHRITFFDILSTKEKQFGFCLDLPTGKFVCLGDEPYNPITKKYVENATWLLSEAFCLYEDRDLFKPYQKHHSTVKEASVLAQELNVKNLVLYHTEEKTLSSRKENYLAEAKQYYNGTVYVPYDLEVISLK